MASKIKVDQIQTADGTGTIALQNQLSGLASASMPSGSVLQTVYANYNTSTSVTSTSATSLGLTASITPISTSSKIIVNVGLVTRCNGDTACDVWLYRNGSSVFKPFNDLGDNGSSAHEHLGAIYFNYIDSPSSTSAVTYLLYGRSNNGTQIMWHANSNYSTITLTEVAG